MAIGFSRRRLGPEAKVLDQLQHGPDQRVRRRHLLCRRDRVLRLRPLLLQSFSCFFSLS